ncbi:hypothetical protein SOPP22_06565 [Shewanella sp. OPT22]|nr:hypothetical protein SOPP22_06565 [Shewanella sp. OPT22]
MLVLAICSFAGICWIYFNYRQLHAKQQSVMCALSAIDTSLKQQIHAILKAVHHADMTMNQKEPSLKALDDYRHAFQSDFYSQHKLNSFNTIQNHLKKCDELNQRITDIAAQLTKYSQIDSVQPYFSVHSEFSTLCRHYNKAVEKYNHSVKVFPSSFIAALFQFSSLPFFDLQSSKATNLWATKASSYQF